MRLNDIVERDIDYDPYEEIRDAMCKARDGYSTGAESYTFDDGGKRYLVTIAVTMIGEADENDDWPFDEE